jgi:predicted dehydrogenase
MKIDRSILIVGFGSIGSRHLANCKRLWPNSKTTVLKVNKTNSTGKILPDKIVYSLEELEESYSFVIIASPTTTHFEYMDYFLKKGIPIFVEKPMCLTMEEWSKLKQNKKAKDIIYVGYTLRHLESLKMLNTKVKRLEIGKILSVQSQCRSYLPDWRPHQDYRKAVTGNLKWGGDIIYELSHELDYINYIFGLPQELTATFGHASSLEIDGHDFYLANMSYDKFSLAIQLDFFSRDAERSLNVFCENGSFRLDLINDKLTAFDPAVKKWNVLYESPDNRDKNEMYLEQFRSFERVLNGSQEEHATLETYKNVLDIIFASYKSHNEKQKVKVGHV